MTPGNEVRTKLQAAVKLIVDSQNPEGGWRYQPVPTDADISVTICQIMALRAEETARSAWEALQAKHGTILGGHALDIERADLGAKGIFYRVRAAGFDTKAAAQSACANLKAAGQDCIVKAR